MVRVRGIILVLALYLAWPLYQVFDYIAVQPFANTIDMANYAASILAYNWLLLNVLLALKLPVLQRWVPYDFRVQAHILSTLAIVAFLAFHAVYYFFLNVKEINAVTWSLTVLFPVLVLLSVRWIPLPVVKFFHRPGPYDLRKTIHKTLYVVVAAFAYFHVVDAKIIGVSSPLASAGYPVLFGVTVVAFALTRLRNRFLPVLTVKNVEVQGATLRLTLNASPRLRYRAGQFAFLRFLVPNLRGEEHPFSFTSVPGEASVQFAIKNVGDFTQKLVQLQPGDRVQVNGGFGAFRPQHVHRPLALVGTGIGAAPLVSLLKDLQKKEPQAPVVCFVSANSREDLVDPDWWDQLPGGFPGLDLKVYLTGQGAPLLGKEVFDNELVHPDRYEYLLCSSSRVRMALVGALESLGVPKKQIHFEEFAFGA